MQPLFVKNVKHPKFHRWPPFRRRPCPEGGLLSVKQSGRTRRGCRPRPGRGRNPARTPSAKVGANSFRKAAWHLGMVVTTRARVFLVNSPDLNKPDLADKTPMHCLHIVYLSFFAS